MLRVDTADGKGGCRGKGQLERTTGHGTNQRMARIDRCFQLDMQSSLPQGLFHVCDGRCLQISHRVERNLDPDSDESGWGERGKDLPLCT